MRDMKFVIFIAVVIMIVSSGSHVDAKGLLLKYGNNDFKTFRALDDTTQSLYVLKMSLPEILHNKRIDNALLEFYVDVSSKDEVLREYSPMIEVYPLNEEFNEARNPSFTLSRAVRNVTCGEDRRVILDITEMIQRWISNPNSNHGLIIGALTGQKSGKFGLRNNALGENVSAIVKVFYRNNVSSLTPKN